MQPAGAALVPATICKYDHRIVSVGDGTARRKISGEGVRPHEAPQLYRVLRVLDVQHVEEQLVSELADNVDPGARVVNGETPQVHLFCILPVSYHHGISWVGHVHDSQVLVGVRVCMDRLAQAVNRVEVVSLYRLGVGELVSQDIEREPISQAEGAEELGNGGVGDVPDPEGHWVLIGPEGIGDSLKDYGDIALECGALDSRDDSVAMGMHVGGPTVVLETTQWYSPHQRRVGRIRDVHDPDASPEPPPG